MRQSSLVVVSNSRKKFKEESEYLNSAPNYWMTATNTTTNTYYSKVSSVIKT